MIAVSPSAAATLRGKLLFAFCCVSGRLAVPVLRLVSERAEWWFSRREFSKQLRQDLLWLANHIKTAPPRQVKFRKKQPPVFLFTDGACEGEQWQNVSCGAVLIDPSTGSKKMFWHQGLEMALRQMEPQGP